MDQWNMTDLTVSISFDEQGNEMVQIFRWECTCGERYSKEEYAWNCKKCRTYLYEKDYRTRVVYDLLKRGCPAVERSH